MSGRSAYVRKKNIGSNKSEPGNGRPRGRPNSGTLNFHHGVLSTSPGQPQPGSEYGHLTQGGTGVGANDARFPTFPSAGGSGIPGPGFAEELAVPGQQRRPPLGPEDVSGIERSGLRTRLEKTSEGVRNGLAHALTFGRHKDKSGDREAGADRQQQQQHVFAFPRPPNHDRDGYPQQSRPFPGHYPRLRHVASTASMVSGGPPSPGPASPWESANSVVKSPLPSNRGAPLASPHPSSVPYIKRWIGSGAAVQRWNKLRKDPELWDPNGDVLVFLGRRDQRPRPHPSFRLSSHIIEATASRPLITLLREGWTEDVQQPTAASFPSPHAAGAVAGQPTPPVSEDNASIGDFDGQISYEMYFPPPPSASGTDRLRHHLATRNVFALLYHASLVGLSLLQALTDLQLRLDACMPPECDVVADMIHYICARGIDDVRSDPESAVGLLAWAEGPGVRWEEGWRECFVHCAGMYPLLERHADFRGTTAVTQALLERAFLEARMRVQGAEERLAEFRYADMWPQTGPVANSPARAAAVRLQRFLLAHYTRIYGRWPPHPAHGTGPSPSSAYVAAASSFPGQAADEDSWLSRTVAQALQKDFGTLYDYLVNRDVVWDGSEFRAGRKWVMVSERGDRSFGADLPDLPMTDMLIEFDNRLRFPHIPHPYPLVPEWMHAADGSGGVLGKEGGSAISMFSLGKKAAVRNANLERRVHLAYVDATNIYVLGSDFARSDLLDAFIRFEKADLIGEVNPDVARRGRWVLLYGILQTLASVSSDTPNLRYGDGVAYHVSPRLGGAKLPPWRTDRHEGGAGEPSAWRKEASHEGSHCWVVPEQWKGAARVGSGVNNADEAADALGPPGSPLRGRALARSRSRSMRSINSDGISRMPSSSGLHGLRSQGMRKGRAASVSAGSDGGASEIAEPGDAWRLARLETNRGGPRRMYSKESLQTPAGADRLTYAEVDQVLQLKRELGQAGAKTMPERSGSASRSGSGSASDSVSGSGGGSSASGLPGPRHGRGNGAGTATTTSDSAGLDGAVLSDGLGTHGRESGGAKSNSWESAARIGGAGGRPGAMLKHDGGDSEKERKMGGSMGGGNGDNGDGDGGGDGDGVIEELDPVSDMDDDDYIIRTPRGVSPLSCEME